MSSENPESFNTPNESLHHQASLGAPAKSSVQGADANWERQILSELVQSNLKEQQASRRWKVGLRLGWLLFWLVVLWLVFSHNQTSTSITKPHTALVNIKGEIADGADASAENVVASMRAALEDSGSQALILLINSPGGSPVQAGIINDEIVRLKALHQKPFMPWLKSHVHRRPITSLRQQTKFMSTRPALWAALGCSWMALVLPA